jgi:hypothetical protein
VKRTSVRASDAFLVIVDLTDATDVKVVDDSAWTRAMHTTAAPDTCCCSVV